MTPSRQGEQSQEQDFAQEIEQALKQMDMDMEKQELKQDIDLMPHHQEVDPPASPNLEVEQVPSDQGDNEIPRDNLEGEMHNVLFDDL